MGKHFGEATVPEGDCVPCTVFALYRGVQIMEKPVRVAERCLAEQRWALSLCWIEHRFTGDLYRPANLSHI